MALEPITRQEQIIAGKDLEPITRMEKFLKKYGGSGGSGGGVSPEEVTTIVKEQFPGGVGYEEVTEIYGDTLTWDGNTDGLVCVDVGVGGLYLISDCVPTQAECSGNVWVGYDKSGEIMEGHIARLGEDFLEDGFLAGQNHGIFIVPNDNYTSSVLGVTFPQKGTYFSSLASDGESLRTISLTIEGYTDFKTVTTIVRKLDEKYLPDGVGGGIKYVTILEDDNGNYTASATYDEITNWIVGGVEVKCVLYGLVLSLTYSDVLRDISLMGAAARIHMFTCVDLHLLSSSPKCVEVRFEENGGVWFGTHPLNEV